MFGLGFTEILVIAVIILIVVKPEDLPGVMKKFGKSYGDVKKTCNEVKKMKDDFVKLADTNIDIESVLTGAPKKIITNELKGTTVTKNTKESKSITETK